MTEEREVVMNAIMAQSAKTIETVDTTSKHSNEIQQIASDKRITFDIVRDDDPLR